MIEVHISNTYMCIYYILHNEYYIMCNNIISKERGRENNLTQEQFCYITLELS